MSTKTTFVVPALHDPPVEGGDASTHASGEPTTLTPKTDGVAAPDVRLHRATVASHLLRSNTGFVSRLYLAKRLPAHRGCVNTIHWNSEGTLLITGSDDCRLNIYGTGPEYTQLYSLRTGHSRNIFCAKFVPYTGDHMVVSCGMDGEIRCAEVSSERSGFLVYSSPMHMVLKMSFLPGSASVFLSTHQDGTVRLFDLRLRENNPENIVVDLRGERGERVAVNSLAMCPLGSYRFALACADPIVRLYDVRMTGGSETGQRTTPEERYQCLAQYCPRSVLEMHCKRDRYSSINVTGVDFNELGEVAATYSRVDAYVFATDPAAQRSAGPDGDPEEPLSAQTAPEIDPAYRNVCTGYLQTFKGHRNARTFLKEIAFLGGNEFVTTGSDCGHAFVWHKRTGRLVNLLKADDSVVNGVAPHPHLPYLATCGIDSDGKVWEPGTDYTFSQDKADRVMGRNSGSDSEDDDGVRISLLNLWNFLTMLRSREAGERRDQELAAAEGGQGLAQHEGGEEGESGEEEEEEEEEEADEDETTAQLIMDLEMVNVADEIRNKGNRFFKAEDYDAAEAEYTRALDHLGALHPQYEEVQRRMKRSRLLCLLNRAACNLKRQQWQQVVDDSAEVLVTQPSNVKALFRRAKALLELQQFDKSLRDILLAEQLSPESEEIKALHEQLREARAAAQGGEVAAMDVESVERKDSDDPEDADAMHES